jgi:hypothetical protein
VVGVGTLLNGGDELPLNVGVIVTVLGVDAGIGELGGTDVDEIDVVGTTRHRRYSRRSAELVHSTA